MRERFDRRVISDGALALLRECQRRVDVHLGGGAALSGAWLSHRLSRDVDLIGHDSEAVRAFVREAPEIARACGVTLEIVRDAGTFVRASAVVDGAALEVDVMLESHGDLAPVETLDGVRVESLADLRASKLTCLLSRSEPRDLVDLLYLDRAGFPPENDLALALRKDAGIDPGVIAWLLGQFPTAPLPRMLEPLTEGELREFRDALRDRVRAVAVPDEG
ncbi:MAG: nucleotidyl transferase AbiEii/AbiGii toxin family protein [Polyangiales bacterium]